MPLNESECPKTRKKFDIDLKFGKQWEEFADELFSGAKTAEVKTERDQWQRTGNIAIETESYKKPSGINATESEVWVHNLVRDGELVASLVIPTKVLKEIVPDVTAKTVMGGDHKASKLNLIPIKKLAAKLLEV